MRKFYKLSPILLLLLISLSITSFIGCKKQVQKLENNNDVQQKQLTIADIKEWEALFMPKLTNPPNLIYELALETTINGKDYIRIPTWGAGSEAGSFYFSKGSDGKIQSLFILINQQDKKQLDGSIGFVDFDHQTINLTIYKNNKPVAYYSVKDTKPLFSNAFMKSSSGIRKQIFSGQGGIPCPGSKTIWQILGEFFSDVWSNINDAVDFLSGIFSAQGNGNSTGDSYASSYLDWNFNVFRGTDVSNPGPYPVGWTPNDAAQYSSMLGDKIEEESDTDFYDESIPTDNEIYNPFQQNQQWPTIPNITAKENFIGWHKPGINVNCFDYAKAQIYQLHWQPGNLNTSDHIQIFTLSNGANITNSRLGVGYLITALGKGIPVIVGIDDQTGASNSDGITDHFVVIVGMGTDTKGNYFRFFDNAANFQNPAAGAYDENKLYYNDNTGIITGKSHNSYATNPKRYDYKVTQIRKSVHKD